MKRIAIISLLAVFLTTNYVYATLTTEEVAQKIEQSQYQKLAQQAFEELLFEYMINYMSDIEPQQSILDNIVTLYILIHVVGFAYAGVISVLCTLSDDGFPFCPPPFQMNQ
jgi:uncharacterized protein YggL (DUF469 family)